MRRVDAGALVVVTGVFALWMGITGTALIYIRPNARVWLTVAGGVLVLFGLALVVLGRWRPEPDDDGHHHHAGRVG